MLVLWNYTGCSGHPGPAMGVKVDMGSDLTSTYPTENTGRLRDR